MRYHFKIAEAENGMFTAHCLEIFSCATIAPSRAEAVASARTALRNYLIRLPMNNLIPVPLIPPSGFSQGPSPRRLSPNIVSVPVEPATALALILRRLRADTRMFQGDVAKRMGLKSVSAYQRLEDPMNSNPTIETLVRLRRVFPSLNFGELFEPDL